MNVNERKEFQSFHTLNKVESSETNINLNWEILPEMGLGLCHSPQLEQR